MPVWLSDLSRHDALAAEEAGVAEEEDRQEDGRAQAQAQDHGAEAQDDGPEAKDHAASGESPGKEAREDRKHTSRCVMRRGTRVVVVLIAVALAAGCGKRDGGAKGAPSAAPSFSVLVPMDTDPPPPVQDAAAPPVPSPGPAHWANTYDDKSDLPTGAGDTRCPPVRVDAAATATRFASVHIELVTQPKPSAELVIPSLGIRKRLWSVTAAPHQNPHSCVARRDASEPSLRFNCGEVMTGTYGKIYARGSDVVLGQTASSNQTTVTRFELPCGTVARFEPVACPVRCDQLDPASCTCSEHSPRWHGAPASTSTPRP